MGTLEVVVNHIGRDDLQKVVEGIWTTGLKGSQQAATFPAQLNQNPASSALRRGTTATASAVHQLVSEGLVDPDEIGIIGFSRTCYYVMYILEMLAPSSVHFKAASVNDGWIQAYLNYVLWLDPTEGAANHFNSIIGAPPFGAGLRLWLERSPGFNLDKVKTPLLVVSGHGRADLAFNMWEPYAGLRYLHKPVELLVLNTDEHILTNPAVRMASQGGSVDWFRFWLQGYEDSDPAKKEQYVRWRELRKLQEENEKKSAAPAN